MLSGVPLFPSTFNTWYGNNFKKDIDADILFGFMLCDLSFNIEIMRLSGNCSVVVSEIEFWLLPNGSFTSGNQLVLRSTRLFI